MKSQSIAKIEFLKIEEPCLTDKQDAEIATLIAETYRADFDGRSYCHQRHHVRYLAYHDDLLVGHLATQVRSINLGGERLTVTGIAEVATAKQFRQLGIATHLLQTAIKDAKSGVSKFILLFGTEQIYARNGFCANNNPITAVDLRDGYSGNSYCVEDEPLMVLCLCDQPWKPDAPIDLLGSVF